ncbi:MLO-like protein 13 [Humulus lupulus]|uniref:MLO-like protein 13 n=1 Tax=Humulus lupulus TaxID=3486 RepID=UPI002B400735|nr:MLO-like protein 13 [Humulus lupulus]
MAEEELSSNTLEFTPTWVVAVVCFVIVLISLCAERSLHKLGKFLLREKQDALFEALQKLKEELMLLGFISLLLTVFQNLISKICIPSHVADDMLPCKRHTSENNHHGRRLLSEGGSGHCKTGKVQMLSLEALHHLHIFIFVLAVVHVVFCVTTMVLGGAKIRHWKQWEDSIRKETRASQNLRKDVEKMHSQHHREFLQHATAKWRRVAIVSWTLSFFKQFYGSVSKSDYIALRQGFIKEHCPRYPTFDFHKYMLRTLEIDFRKIVGISWYLWLFVVIFLLLNMNGWHSYFWLSFLPLILLLLVGAKLEHIITRLAQEVVEKKEEDQESQQKTGREKTSENETLRVKPSDEHFWFRKPGIVLILIHFILFQNSFEMAFLFWIWCTYGFDSCIMEKVGYIIPRLFIGVIVQVLCSYSTLPLYTIVTQMGSMFKEGMFRQQSTIIDWFKDVQSKTDNNGADSSKREIQKMDTELSEIVQITEPEPAGMVQIAEQSSVVDEGGTSTYMTDLSHKTKPPFSSS